MCPSHDNLPIPPLSQILEPSLVPSRVEPAAALRLLQLARDDRPDLLGQALVDLAHGGQRVARVDHNHPGKNTVNA